ncbi:MAG: arylsulfatase [Gammaproteobacteria bacterium]|nr:arylsulfatase [Gammaproteobacteria bacterium]
MNTVSHSTDHYVPQCRAAKGPSPGFDGGSPTMNAENDKGSGRRRPPYDGFDGKVGRTFQESSPSWPKPTSARPGSPNIILMLVDDMGYSDIGCFGGEIPTPNLDAIASQGLRFTDFHATPKCSPTRASLMTGVDHHLAGYADVVHFDPGYPNYRMELDVAPTIAERLRDQGYSTLMVGKWHLAREAHMAVDAPRRNWPLQKGFDEFYGFLDGFTSLHDPHQLIEGNSIRHVDEYPDGYYLTDDLSDHAVQMLRDRYLGEQSRPFFLYFAHAAVHFPLEAKQSDIELHRGRYQMGWDRARQDRFERQKLMEIVTPDTRLPSGEEEGYDIPKWDALTAEQQAIFARYMEVYAAMVSSIDRSVGQLRDYLVDTGQWDNTLFLFLSDNGASQEGGPAGSPYYFSAPRIHGLPQTDEHKRLVSPEFAHSIIDLIGSPDTKPAYNWGWARASNTPFRLFKRQTHAGGHTVPAILSWPTGVADKGALRRQYLHVTDVLPTIMALVQGEEDPELDVDGFSFVDSIQDAEAVSRHRKQYYEMDGNRGMYVDRWEIVARYDGVGRYSDEDWELYDHTTDPTQTTDLSSVEVERTADMAADWESTAWEKQVFPLTDDSGLKDPVSPERRRVSGFTRILAGAQTLDRYRSQILVQMRSFDVRIEFGEGYRPGDEGVLVAQGDQGGGYLVYVEDGHLHFCHNYGGRARDFDMGAAGSDLDHIDIAFLARADGVCSVNITIGDDARKVPAEFNGVLRHHALPGIDVGIDRVPRLKGFEVTARDVCRLFGGPPIRHRLRPVDE